MSESSFIEKLRRQLEEWDYQLDRFEHRVGDLSQDLQAKAKSQVAEFRGKRRELEGRIGELEKASERALEDLRDGIELAWDGLKTGFYAARSEFEKDDDK
jgi:chromosome segregation ATPase